MKKIYILIALLMSLIFSGTADAKWWIFGQSNEEVSINYMYLNKIAYEESGPKVTLYKGTLPEGKAVITGKASARAGKIGRVRVTTNNKETWEKAKLSDNGAFEFSFTPDENNPSIIYVEIADSAGKTNDVEATRKELSLSGQNIQGAIKEVLDAMIAAYRAKDPNRFKSFVSEDFVNDEAVLDSAVRRDFSSFDNIDLRYTLNNVTVGANGIYVSLNYSRMVTSAKSGHSYSDRGTTEFVFRMGESGPKVYSMKAPMIFGVCKAAETLNGVVNMASNDKVTVCDPSGNVAVVSFSDAINSNWGEDSGASSGGTPLTMTYLNNGPGILWWFNSFSFDGTISRESWGNLSITGEFGIYGDSHHLLTRPDVQVKDMGVRTLDSIVTADASGYAYSNGSTLRLADGHSYVFKLAGGGYGAIEVRSLSVPITMLRYKYAPSGPNF